MGKSSFSGPLYVGGAQVIPGGAMPYLLRPGDTWYVDGTNGTTGGDAKSWENAVSTVTAALAKADRGDKILIAGDCEYDENVSVTLRGVVLVGCGAPLSVRITGLTNGTGLTIDGTAADGSGYDVAIYNLNCEGRGTGGGIKATGLLRRITIDSCKAHGGAEALIVDGNASQIVEAYIRGNVIGLATNGIKLGGTGGGDPLNQIYIENNKILRCDTDMLRTVGRAADLFILNNYFGNKDGTEPTRFLDIDDTSTSGLVAGNFFAYATNASAKLKIASGVMWGPNGTEAGWSTARPS